MNLMLNAIDAMRDWDGLKELTIKSQRNSGNQLLVSLSDNGPGLPSDKADKIFDAFSPRNPKARAWGFRSVGR
jgi:C4-dicarboxylate-specific signal transduction histidine kinase